MASRQMLGLRKGPTTDVGVAQGSRQGGGDCWWAFESVSGWQGRFANRPYGLSVAHFPTSGGM